MRNSRTDVLAALEEALCAREEAVRPAPVRMADRFPLPAPDLAAQILDLVEADRIRTSDILQQAMDQLEQLDMRVTRSEARAREAEELLQHLYRCTEAHNEAKDMLKHLYRRIETQLTGAVEVSDRGALFGRSAA